MTTTTGSPFHRGEQAVQERQGVRETMEAWGRKVIRGYLPEQHRAFYAELPFVVAAARDADARPWATILTGTPGFAAAPGRQTLAVGALPGEGDPLAGAFTNGADVGLLGIDFAARRQNRACR